jgi:hypothetical protein
MNSNDKPDSPTRRKWPLKTLIEILPIIIALTVFFSYSTIKRVSDVALVTPISEVFGQVSLWIVLLMGLIFGVGLLGMGWLIYLFSRAPISPDGESYLDPADEVKEEI